MQLITFGRVHLPSCAFSRPKPLLLLAYLTLEGPQERRRLAELFWPGADDGGTLQKNLGKLSVVLAQFKREGAGGAFPDRPGLDLLVSLAGCDAADFVAAADSGAFGRAADLYRGPFLHTFTKVLPTLELSGELLDWTLEKREGFAQRARGVMLELAEAALRSDRPVDARAVGGGVGPSDDVRCVNALGITVFRGHDTHIRDIIRAVAPDVRFSVFKVCNAQGTCSSAEIVRALMRTVGLAGGNPNLVVNLSLGGPLPDRPSFEVLKLLGERFGVSAVASGGNGPFAPAHYPAGYSAGVAPASAPSLENVVSVAAAGLKLDADGNGNPGYVIAGFNTRGNADVFAPGVDVCPASVQTFRCDLTQTYPDDLGLTGSSFSVPAVTGLAALFSEIGQAVPTNLRACLKNNALSDPLTGVERVAFGHLPCP